MGEPPASVAQRLASLGCAAVSDAMDRLGVAGQPVGVVPVGSPTTTAGPAFTVRYEPVGRHGGSVGDFLDDVPAGSMIVIDNRSRLDATVWGDLMTIVAARNAVAGTVIDGVCRDTTRAVKLGYPIFARGSFMRTGKDRVALAALGETVTVGGCRVDPGDLVVGDADGVVLIPAGRAGEVAEVGEKIAGAEAQIRSLIAGGSRLDIARQTVGYHHLQSAAGGEGSP